MNQSSCHDQGKPRRIAIIGCGLIGQAWAVVFVRAGYEVALFDQDIAVARAAPAAITERLADLEKAGLLSPSQMETVQTRVLVSDKLEHALKNAFYVQENTAENLQVKARVTAEIDAALAPDVPIGSSTSGIPASSYANEVSGRSRCIVAHPINPPHLVPAVEIVPAPFTAPEVTEKVRELMQQVGQSAIVLQKEVDGFVVNRLQGALLREAFDLLAKGIASADGIDRAISDGLGLRWALMGPFQTIHLNAPEGVAQYVQRYGPMYQEMFANSGEQRDWDNIVTSGLEDDLLARFPLDRLQEAQSERDTRLMSLLRALHDPAV